MSAEKKSWLARNGKSLFIVILCLLGVFGGLGCLIHADYVSAAAANGWYWAAGILMGGFVLFFIVWFATSGRKNS